MLTIDSQVHPYERDHPGRPWVSRLPGPPEVSGPALINAMDAAGVDAAILVSAWTLYRYDASYAVSVRDLYPGRFALIKPLDTSDPAIAEVIVEWNKVPGRIGVRIMPADVAGSGVDVALSTAARLGLPVNLAYTGEWLDAAAQLAEAYPDCRLVIDHLGLSQPLARPTPDNPFRLLPKVLNMAKYANVAIKISGACTLSTQGYPFDDIWAPVLRIIDAFGVDRCMWGTDWTRTLEFASYRQAVDVFRNSSRLSKEDRQTLMGGALERIYRWTPNP
jgi:predicted TIM-barrel fold metal-dependent hydrolase